MDNMSQRIGKFLRTTGPWHCHPQEAGAVGSHADRPIVVGSPIPAARTRGAYLSYVHSLRGCAIVAVVAVHVVDAAGWDRASAGPLQNMISALLGNATVLFIFVAGFLFQHLSHRFCYESYLVKRLGTVVLPYLVMSTPTLMQQYLKHTGVFTGTTSTPPLLVAAHAYLTGAQMPIPFWYVPVIILFFVAAPLFVTIDQYASAYWLLVPAFGVGALIHRSAGATVVWQSAIYFLSVYLLGMAASHYRETWLGLIGRYRWGILALAIALFSMNILLLRHRGPIFSKMPFSTEAGVVDLDLFAKSVLALFLLEWFRRHDERLRRWFTSLADASFGIFFVHGYFTQSLSHTRWWQHLSDSPVGVAHVVLSVGAVVLFSLFCTRVAQRVLGRLSRFAIGC